MQQARTSNRTGVQLDMDGCEVGVSRQAIDETLEEYDAMLAALRTAFKVPRPWINGGRTITEEEWGTAVDAITAAIAIAERSL